MRLMNWKRRAKLFRIGRDRALRIPREFDFPGNEVLMCREGDRLVLAPVKSRSLAAILDSLEPLDEEFPDIPDAPPEPVDL